MRLLGTEGTIDVQFDSITRIHRSSAAAVMSSPALAESPQDEHREPTQCITIFTHPDGRPDRVDTVVLCEVGEDQDPVPSDAGAGSDSVFAPGELVYLPGQSIALIVVSVTTSLAP